MLRLLRQSVRLSSSCAAIRPSFPCVDVHAQRASRIVNSDTPYARPNPGSYNVYHHPRPFPLTYAPPLPAFDIAYESWGTLSPSRDNVILLHTGLSASSHAASTPLSPTPGWWEKFIGPGKALDTDQFFIICTNVLGGCYGSTGPSSIDPTTGQRFATRFPILSIFDMVKAQLAAIGVHLVADFNDTPTFTKAMDAGNFQLAYYSWYADYPDAEDFYQLVYSKNVAPGPNAGAFVDAAYDKAYETSRFMVNGPQRYELFKQLNAILRDEVPVIPLYESLRSDSLQKWVGNYKRNIFTTEMQFMSVDMAAKKRGL